MHAWTQRTFLGETGAEYIAEATGIYTTGEKASAHLNGEQKGCYHCP